MPGKWKMIFTVERKYSGRKLMTLIPQATRPSTLSEDIIQQIDCQLQVIT